MQTKKMSLTETLTSVGVGYIVALISQILIFPVFDIHVHIRDNVLIGLYFTAISIIRSYLIRRCFTKDN